MHHIQFQDILGFSWLEMHGTKILGTKYQWTDVAGVVAKQHHLTAAQQADILVVLQENEKLFDGSLGIYRHTLVHIDIDPDVKPAHVWPYPVTLIHLATFKKKSDHLVCLGVLKPQQENKWASPSYLIPNKYGSVHWISDLWKLNKVIKQKQYLLPVIMDILRKCVG
jgi:hypothetical protein